MKKVFLTGATGVMGTATLNELLANRESQGYDITLLVRPSKVNKRKMEKYIEQGVKVLWGDLLDEAIVDEGVREADIVLHLGGLVSPQADKCPEKTLRVNVGAAENIVRAAKAKEAAGGEVAVVYIGSVSQYGPRMEPRHWGKCGDHINVAVLDAYALSKVKAERIVAESGLRRWVSLRQTGILHTGLLNKADDPISFHVPLKGVLEWVTDEDSGRLMERICRDGVPDDFWCRYYNIGGGEKFRLSNYEFISMVLSSIGCPPPEKCFDARWFALDNFHGMWYLDSDRLEDLFHFRSGEGPAEYFKRKSKELPFYFRLTPLAPGWLIKSLMKLVAKKSPLGPLSWEKNGDMVRLHAFFCSSEAYKHASNWDKLDLRRSSEEPLKYWNDPSGYDLSTLSDDDINVHVFSAYSGKYLGNNEWQCKHGHRWSASPALVFQGGHWCPECLEATFRGDHIKDYLSEHHS